MEFEFENLVNFPFYKKTFPKDDDYNEKFKELLKLVSKVIIDKHKPDLEYDTVNIKETKTRTISKESVVFKFYSKKVLLFKKRVSLKQEFIDTVKRNFNNIEKYI